MEDQKKGHAELLTPTCPCERLRCSQHLSGDQSAYANSIFGLYFNTFYTPEFYRHVCVMSTLFFCKHRYQQHLQKTFDAIHCHTMPQVSEKNQIFLKKINFSLVQDEFESIITETMQLTSGLEFTLTEGLPQERLVALRQCIEKTHINKPGT